MTGVIRWADPPPHRNLGQRRPHAAAVDQTPRWAAIAAELRAAPGRWAVIEERAGTGTAGAMTRRIRTGGRACWAPPGSFDAVSRRRDDGDGIDLYARYVGGTS